MSETFDAKFIDEEPHVFKGDSKEKEVITEYSKQLISDTRNGMSILFPVILEEKDEMEYSYLQANKASVLPCLVSVFENKESSQRLEYSKSPSFNIKKILYDTVEKSVLSQEEKDDLFRVLDGFLPEEAKFQEDIYFSLELDDMDTPVKKLVEYTDKELHKKKEVAKAYTYLMLTEATQ